MCHIAFETTNSDVTQVLLARENRGIDVELSIYS